MYMPIIPTRVLCAVWIVFIELVSSLVLSILPDNDIYYLVCIGFNAVIVIGLDTIGDEKIVSDLMDCNLLALFVQIAGLAIYWSSLPVELYNFH